MKKTILIISSVVFLASTFAQSLVSVGSNDKYIEVKVTDTMMVQAEIMTLMVKLSSEENDDYKYDDYNYDEKEEEKQKREEQNKIKAKKAKVEAIFAKYKVSDFKYHEKDKNKNPFSKDFSIYEDAYEATLNNVNLFTKLRDELLLVEGVSVNITQAEIKDKHSYELQLLEKLMNKAKKEAQVIAKQMGATLGVPLNVSNQSWDDMYTSMFSKPESMGGMGALFGMIGNMFNTSKQTNMVTLSKTIVVRFSVGN